MSMLEYLLTPPVRAQFSVGEEVDVDAWWTKPEGELLRCRVEKVHDASSPIYYSVRPVAGANPHGRFVKATDCHPAFA